MCGVLRSFITALCTLAVLFSSLQLCAANSVYAEKGSSVELPCPCPRCPEQSKEMNWYFDQKNTAVLLFRKVQQDSAERQPAAWDRLEMLPDYSLAFSNVTDSDTGRYWCDPNNYFDLVVVTGTKLTMESRRADRVCYILSCSVSDKNIQHSVVRWWEGARKLQDEEKKGGASIFKGGRASQLHLCVRKETTGDQKGLRTKERRVKCSFADHLEITFNLTGAVKDCLSVCPNATGSLERRGHGGTWIPLAVCVTLQLIIILALGVALWRRNHRKKKREDYFTMDRSERSTGKKYMNKEAENQQTLTQTLRGI
ncbi:lymphocyte antigen 6 complex locus protein G6f isoform X2 [Paroedura picta]|uniref:lymphocyte antigen 6 complex locus protein G6f isoform X2 n=1 Tax=Paroedura picta TaxID=143630 RepID=UPI004056170D